MKYICLLLMAICGYIPAFCQEPPVHDSLIPMQHRDDTIEPEPKLQGGALIDTVNIRDTIHYQPGYLKDTLESKNRKVKPKSLKD